MCKGNNLECDCLVLSQGSDIWKAWLKGGCTGPVGTKSRAPNFLQFLNLFIWTGSPIFICQICRAKGRFAKVLDNTLHKGKELKLIV